MSNTQDREILIERIINAPRELVWKAWTDPKHLEKWWGPNGFTTTTKEFDLRVGGIWRHIMHGPDGTNYPNVTEYTEITRPERLRYLHGGGEEEGVNDAQFEATITFEDMGEKTKVTMHSLFPSAKHRDYVAEHYGAIEGGIEHLANLDEYVQTMT